MSLLRVHRIIASVLSTARNFLHAFPAHIDSSSMPPYNTPHYSLVDSASPICKILESLSLSVVLWNLPEEVRKIQILNSMSFLQIFSLDLFILKIIHRAESRECYSFVRGMLFSLVERSVPHCMFARRYFACSQNSSRRSARSRTLPCKILIVCHVSQNSCIPFVSL